MFKKFKKLLKILLVCFLMVSNARFISLYQESLETISNRDETIDGFKKQSEELNEEIDLLKKSRDEANQEKETRERELEELRTNYDELERKYLEEIKPVSFNSNNLWEKSNATVNDMTVALFGTGLEEVAYAYVKAEKEWGVIAIFVASLTAEESGWGRSNRAINQNNLSGYAVYSAGASGRSFSSKEESIMETAKLICQQYLKPTGAYYNGISIYDVNIKYCPNDGGTWSKNISSIAYSLVSKINNR